MIVRAQFGVDGDLELLERAAVPKIGLHAVAVELAELIGKVIGRQVDPLGSQSAAFKLVGSEIAVGRRQPLLDGRRIVAEDRARRDRKRDKREGAGGSAPPHVIGYAQEQLAWSNNPLVEST